MEKQKIRELIPLGLIVAGLIYTAIIVMTTDTALTNRHLIAYSLTFIVVVTFFIKKRLSNIILGFTIILGLLNVIAFTPYVTTIGAGVELGKTDITLGIQFFSLIVFITFLYANKQAIKAWINKDGL